ncbi:hypothetical protein YQE_04284, partial [Dendroctonus ponderosae]
MKYMTTKFSINRYMARIMMTVTNARSFMKRFFSSVAQSRNCLQHLKERSLVQVKGPDASNFLQGLITNDINHLSDRVGSMFAMFLNIRGRILFDTLIYKTEVKDEYWIECDRIASTTLQKHLKMYKVKRQVDITGLDDYEVHVLYSSKFLDTSVTDFKSVIENAGKSDFPESSAGFRSFNSLLIFKDPRVPHMGFRILSKRIDVQSVLNSLVECDDSNSYRKLKFSLGIGEGIEDLLSGSSFPLECNCDYLHGVSFHKGCYIGQELTARTYHTGVIRKRLMPLHFSKVPTALPEGNIVINKSNLGKLRGIEGNVGLALLRVAEALELGSITVGNGEASIVKPFWWPVELPKEKLNVPTPVKHGDLKVRVCRSERCTVNHRSRRKTRI